MTPYDHAAWELLAKHLARTPAPNPSTHAKTLVLLPEASPVLLDLLSRLGDVAIVQDFRPYYSQFLATGIQVLEDWPREAPTLILMVATRQRQETLGYIAKALLTMGPETRFIFACANAQGAPGFMSQIKELNSDLEIESGNKCRLVDLRRSDIRHPEILQTWLADAGAAFVAGTEFHTVPGIYGWNKVDRGSELLASTLPALSGIGYDLGAGYGYLSHAVLSADQNFAVEKVHLVEADRRALACAQENLQPWAGRAEFHWRDVVGERTELLGGARADWIVMNPPFHEGRSTDADLGGEFISTAAQLLKKDGQLFLVANSFLPYEKIMAERFRKSSRVLETDGFKVIHAQR